MLLKMQKKISLFFLYDEYLCVIHLFYDLFRFALFGKAFRDHQFFDEQVGLY